MSAVIKSSVAAAAALLAVFPAFADVSLMAARLGAQDVLALEKFYETAFGLKEVNRIEFRGQVEVMLNFGANAPAAKANSNAQVVIMHRDSDAIADTVPHLIFDVSDVAATVTAIKAAGGKTDGEPRPFGNSGMIIGLATDPAGNRLELIQRAKH
jgi:predicted enzyme related to lactoylglutathione lyase